MTGVHWTILKKKTNYKRRKYRRCTIIELTIREREIFRINEENENVENNFNHLKNVQYRWMGLCSTSRISRNALDSSQSFLWFHRRIDQLQTPTKSIRIRKILGKANKNRWPHKNPKFGRHTFRPVSKTDISIRKLNDFIFEMHWVYNNGIFIKIACTFFLTQTILMSFWTKMSKKQWMVWSSPAWYTLIQPNN